MTNDILCGYAGDREAMLMAYLYDDIAPGDRQAFEQHLATCARCRTELNGLGDVRAQLARWSPPEPNVAGVRRQTSIVASDSITGITGAAAAVETDSARRSWWQEVPAWAQVAAALLVLGVSAGIANLDIRYDSNGLNIRTGWARPAAAADPSAVASTDAENWRAQLASLEQQLRSEFRASQSAASSATGPTVPVQIAHSSDADLMRRVKALVDDSERRQRNELALRMGEAIRDLNSQRQADLRKIDQNLGIFQDRTGVEVLRNRQKLDYILQRVSQQPQ
jgi:hypothetical protein